MHNIGCNNSNMIFYGFQDREFVEVDLPFASALKKGGPAAELFTGEGAPSPTPSDSASQSLFNNCCGKSNCCRKVCIIYSII